MGEIKRQLNQKEYERYIQEWKEENKELIESGKCRKVFIENLPKFKDGTYKDKINWQESMDYDIHFIYNDYEDNIKLINVNRENNRTYLTIKHKDKKCDILTGSLRACQLGILLGIKTKEFSCH